MNQLLKNLLLFALLCSTVFLGRAQKVYGQSASIEDSVRHLLIRLQDKTKDEKLKLAIKEAKARYTGNVLTDSLALKLLTVDSLIIDAQQPDQQLIDSYAQVLTRLLKQLPPHGKHPHYATSLNNLAYLYYNMGQYEKALPLYQQALAIREKALGKEHPEYATSLHNLADLYESMGQYEKALPLYQQALAIREKALGKEHPEYTESLNNLAYLYESMGQYEKALPLYQQALAIREITLGKEHPEYAISINNLAVLYQRMGQYEKALSLHQQALAIREKVLGKEHPDYAFTLGNLAVLNRDIGQYEKALPLYQQALAIREKVLGKEHPDYATSLNNLAGLYREMGQYQKALSLYQQASAIFRKALGREHPYHALSLHNLAYMNERMGQYEKALPLYQQALAIREKVLGKEHPEYAFTLGNLAVLYQSMGQYEKALSLHQQALAIREKVLGKEHPDYATSLNNLAGLYREMGQYQKALSLYQQASAIFKKALGREHPEYALSLNNLAVLHSLLNNNTEALNLFIQATHINLNQIVSTYSTLSEQEKMTLMTKESSKFNYLPSLLFTTNSSLSSSLEHLYNIQLLLKGSVLQDQQNIRQSIRQSNDSTISALYEQWAFNRKSLGRQLLLPLSERVPYLDSLQEATNQLEQQLSRRSAAFRQQLQSQSFTVTDLAQKLQQGEVAIEFIHFSLYDKKWTDSIMYAALVLLPQDTTVHFLPLFEEKQLQRLLNTASSTTYHAVSQLYDKKKTARQNSFANSLYQLVWQPLERYLQGIETVYYSPTGLLHRIAFQALPTDSTQQFIDKYQLHQVLSTRSIALSKEGSTKPLSASLWGNIDYSNENSRAVENSLASAQRTRGQDAVDATLSPFNFYTWDTKAVRGGGGWEPLPYTKAEMDSLKTVLTKAGIVVSTLSGSSASEEAFKSLSGKSPQVLHLATHGFFLPVRASKAKEGELTSNNAFTMQQNPMFRSGLVLAGGNHTWKGGTATANKEDGILTAYELAQMDLSNTDLVVLSACETALGDLKDNEGVIGLQRALKMAGVKEVIATLWQVPDKVTMQLMMLFYKNWLKGQSTREALRQAQLQLKEKYPHPYFWAAFVLVE